MADATTKFVYLILIRAPAAKVWDALLLPEFTRQYWYEVVLENDGGWKPGSNWIMRAPHGGKADEGQVEIAERPTRLVLSWTNRMVKEMEAEGMSRCSFELKEEGGVTHLTVTHEIFHAPPSKFIDGVAWGWPRILSSMKSLLETGESLPETREWPKDI